MKRSPLALRSLPILASIGTLLVPSVAFAQAGGIRLRDLQVPILPGGGDPFTVLVRLIDFFLIVAGIAAFVYMLWAGFNYLTAGGDEGKVKVARQTIINAIIGIIIIAISFVLINFVVSELRSRGGVTTTPAATPTIRVRRP